jgi:ribonuclease D
MIIRKTHELEAVCERARRAGRVGLDTEFHSEDTFYPRLALVQLAVEDDVVVVDPLAEGISADPLIDLLADPAVEVVAHAAEADVAIIYHLRGKAATRVYDTQVAAALLGMGMSISYGKLVKKACGVSLPKLASFTNWLRRPLSDEQLEYARQDVRYLFQMRDWLHEQLMLLGREAWLDEQLAPLHDPARLDPKPEQVGLRVRGPRELDALSRHVLKALSIWRETACRERDVPRKRVLLDPTMVEIARRRPATRQALFSVRGMRRNFKGTDEVLALIAAATKEAATLPREGRGRGLPQLPPADPQALAVVRAVLGVIAQDARIDMSLLATQDELEALLRERRHPSYDPSHHPILNGWRGELAGQALLAFIEGRRVARLDPESGGVALIEP